MKEFLLIFRTDVERGASLTPEQLQKMVRPWNDWMGSVAAQNKLVDRGNRLEFGGKIVKPGKVTNGPYVEIKEAVGGYTLIRAENIEEAAEIAKGCPILTIGGNVEVRPIAERETVPGN